MPAVQKWGRLFHLLFLHRALITHEVRSRAEGPLGKPQADPSVFPLPALVCRLPSGKLPGGGLSGPGCVCVRERVWCECESVCVVCVV